MYDRRPDVTPALFRELLYRHVKSELPEDYLSKTFGIATDSLFAEHMFSSAEAYTELVRASEGVARDLINIFTAALFSSQRRNRDKVDMKGIAEGAREWYEKDKAINLSEEQREVLRRIIDEVIGTRRARSFLLEKRYEKEPLIQSLFDYRIIHLAHRGYSDNDNPGLRYNIYTLDYGTFVDLRNTTRQPELAMPNIETVTNSEERIVPFDDKRSIRRIVLRPEIFLSREPRRT
ncbi:MAG: hypothetical protein M1305_01400 [Candidatus Marsarchaeota archaeon]|nr:hypothetical protein [Candidatus Marsarchaeota archaeon]